MSKVTRQCKERTCFVPQCRSGYCSNNEKVFLFTAPADAVQLAEWEKMTKRADRRLTPTSVICEKPFEDSCIECCFKITANGKYRKADASRKDSPFLAQKKVCVCLCFPVPVRRRCIRQHTILQLVETVVQLKKESVQHKKSYQFLSYNTSVSS